MTKNEKIIMDAINKTKAKDVKFYNVKGKSVLTDAIIICTALNDRNLNGLENTIEEVCAENKIAINHIEGRNDSRWIVIDLNDIVVHLLTEDERLKFNLEELLEK